jgi:two-component system response regulator NreC
MMATTTATTTTATTTPANATATATGTTTQILLADDHRIVREGLRGLLESQSDLRVVGEADNGRRAVELADELSPDVVVMDVGMPQLNGIEATRKVLAEHPQTKVVALSMHADRRYVVEMLKAGASAYVLKDGAFEELVNAIRTVAGGRVYISPRVADVVVEDYVRQAPPAAGGSTTPSTRSAYAALSPREREVLQLLAEGKATKEVAGILHVSIKTVETHRRQIMQKLDV